MRLKYYRLTLRQRSKNTLFVFFVIQIFVILICIFTYNQNVKPVLTILCESKAKSIALNCSNKAVYDTIKNVKYENLITIQKDKENKVTSLAANVMEMNKISNEVTSKVQEELQKNNHSNIILPIGSFVGFKRLGGYGPKLKIKTVPSGDVSAKFKSDFKTTGINQTKHSIILEISTNVRILAPFFTESKTYVNNITVAETVIVGNTPNSYYDVRGNEEAILDLIE